LKFVHQILNYKYYDSKTKRTLDNTKPINTFGVNLKNKSKEKIKIGIFNLVWNLIRQVKNNKGEWIDIERNNPGLCGTGMRTISFKPEEIIIAKLLRYKGDYYRECRLKYEVNNLKILSNSFYDKIDSEILKIIEQKMKSTTHNMGLPKLGHKC
jgi:hypothetical protein